MSEILKKGAGAHWAWSCCVYAEQEEGKKKEWRYAGAWGPMGERGHGEAMEILRETGKACARLAKDGERGFKFDSWTPRFGDVGLGLGSSHAQLALRPPPMSSSELDALCEALIERLMEGLLSAGAPWTERLSSSESIELAGLQGVEAELALTRELGRASAAGKERAALAREIEGAGGEVKKKEVRL